MAQVIFYSAQTGKRGFIPSIKEQKLNSFTYLFFHDSHYQAIDDKGWTYRNMYHQFRELPDPKRQRLIKMCPHLFMHLEYDYTVWVDCKFYQHRKFYELCNNIIEKEKYLWLPKLKGVGEYGEPIYENTKVSFDKVLSESLKLIN